MVQKKWSSLAKTKEPEKSFYSARPRKLKSKCFLHMRNTNTLEITNNFHPTQKPKLCKISHRMHTIDEFDFTPHSIYINKQMPNVLVKKHQMEPTRIKIAIHQHIYGATIANNKQLMKNRPHTWKTSKYDHKMIRTGSSMRMPK